MGKSDHKKGYDTRLPFRHRLTISHVWDCGQVFAMGDDGLEYQFEADIQALSEFFDEYIDFNEVDKTKDLLNQYINKKDYGKASRQFFACFSRFAEYRASDHNAEKDQFWAIEPLD